MGIYTLQSGTIVDTTTAIRMWRGEYRDTCLFLMPDDTYVLMIWEENRGYDVASIAEAEALSGEVFSGEDRQATDDRLESTMADELVYCRAYSEQGPDFVVAHRIIKRTKTRLYIDRQIDHEHSRAAWDEYPEQRRCFTLDRTTFEREGCAIGKRFGLPETFYASAAQALR